MSAQSAVRKDTREDVILLGDKKESITVRVRGGDVHCRLWRKMRSQSSRGQRREARLGRDTDPEAFNEVTCLGNRRMTLSSCNMCAMISESENRASQISEMKLKLFVFMDVVLVCDFIHMHHHDLPSSVFCVCSRVQLFAIPWTAAHQAPLQPH